MKQRIRIEFTAIEQGACEMLYATLRTFYNKGWIDRDYSMEPAQPQNVVQNKKLEL